MSDTPRTNERFSNPPTNDEAYEFACGLEKEINQWKACAHELQSALKDGCYHAQDPGDEQGTRTAWNAWERAQSAYEKKKAAATSTFDKLNTP